MREFGEWLMQVPEKKDEPKKKVELNTRREMLTEMMDDMNRMLSDHDSIHPDSISPQEDITHISATRDNYTPLYNNNMYEEEWSMYTTTVKHEE